MSDKALSREILSRAPFTMPRFLTKASVIFIIVGVIAFLVGANGAQSTRVWQVFLVNLLFWTGIAHAGIVFSAIMHITKSRWGLPMKRLAEAFSGFIPISFILFFFIALGRHQIFPWLNPAMGVDKTWLTFPFLFTRDITALFVLGIIGFAYLYFSIRPDAGLAMESGQDGSRGCQKFLTKNWRGTEEELTRCHDMNSTLAILVIMAYVLVYSLLAFDLIMSLDPGWISNLFGGYYFISNFYLGLAFMTIMSIAVRKYYKLEEYITIGHIHDIGKLLFGFCFLTGYMMWTQFLVIWYGNLQHEVSFIMTRAYTQPWRSLGILVMIIMILGPFLFLLPRFIKRHPKRLFTVAVIIMVAIWLERFLMIVPSTWHEGTFPLGLMEILITLGFFGAVMLCFFSYFRHLPMLPISDPRLEKGYHIHTY